MNKKSNPKEWNIDTKLVRGGSLRSNFGETSEAIFMTSGFSYDSAETAESRFNGENPGFVYSRYSNPNIKMLEEKLSLIEGAERCCATASGMAAVFGSFACQMKPGEHVIASRVMFGSCHYVIKEILPRMGLEVTLVDGRNMEEWEKAFQENTKYVFIESPSNPNLEIIDIEALSKLCKKNNTTFIVDNVFATPLLQKPLLLGADIVIYSTTKHIDGQGRTLGGAVLGTEKFIDDLFLPFHRHTGSAISPFNAWIAVKGLETLSLRLTDQCTKALKIATTLEKECSSICNVIYPHLPSYPQYQLALKQMSKGGNLISFEVKGSKKDVFSFLNKLRIIDISNNLGDTKTIITHPATTTHANINKDERKILGITENLLRLSVGSEDLEDLINDIKQAADKI